MCLRARWQETADLAAATQVMAGACVCVRARERARGGVSCGPAVAPCDVDTPKPHMTWQDFLICLEMLLFSLVHHWVFSYRCAGHLGVHARERGERQRGRGGGGGREGEMESVREICGLCVYVCPRVIPDRGSSHLSIAPGGLAKVSRSRFKHSAAGGVRTPARSIHIILPCPPPPRSLQAVRAGISNADRFEAPSSVGGSRSSRAFERYT